MLAIAVMYKGSKMQEVSVEEFNVGNRSLNRILAMFTYLGKKAET